MGMLAKLFKALNSDASPWQLAFGFALGMIMGFTPLLGLHSVLLLFVVLFFRVNISSFLLAWAAFSALAIPLSGPFANIGESLLMNDSMQATWAALYSTYLGQLTQFYHTLTLGSLLISVLLFPCILLISKRLIDQYRERFMHWVSQWRIVQVLKGSRFYQLYEAMGE